MSKILWSKKRVDLGLGKGEVGERWIEVDDGGRG